MHPDQDAERLLAETDWLRRLARSLVAGRDAADDVVQETMLRALRTPAAGLRNLRGWLAVVAANVARRLSRSAARERRRVDGLPPRDHEPSVADAVARADAQQRVIRALLALPDPYRSVLVLRFQQELGYAAIAARLHIPVETVRTQIKRGLQRLRDELEERHGGRAAWSALLPPAFTRTAAGALPFAALAVVAAGTAWLAYAAPLPEPEVVASPAVQVLRSALPAGGVPSRSRTNDSPSPERIAGAELEPQPRVEPEAARATNDRGTFLRGRVVDVSTGSGIANAEVRVTTDRFVKITPSPPEAAPVVADACGRFQVEGRGRVSPQTMLEVRAAGYAALVVRPYAVLDRLFQARADTGQQSQAADSTTDMGDVWMEPQVERRFRVVTATGLPADGAELHALSVAGQLLWSDVIATCDSLGIARAVLPTHRDATTTIVATHGDAVGVATLDAPAAEHVIRLGAIADLTVDVVDETGRPLRCHVFAEARCVPSRFGAQHIVSSPLPGRMRSSSQADAGGRAVVTGLPLPAHEGTCRLTVVASDCRGECRDVQLQAGANFVRVVMARGGVATVSGRVVDAETLRPIARAEVGPCRTDDDGTFSIADLDVRYGRVQLTVRANGYVAGAIDEPVGGRAGAITVHAALRPAARITGTIVDAAGEPVLGARVSCDGAEAGMSDATGRFTMSVPRGPVTLRVEPPFSPPPTPQPLDVEVDAAAAGSHTIVVGTR